MGRDGRMCDRAGLSTTDLPFFCLRMPNAEEPRHRVPSQFRSDFYNVNHILYPGPDGYFCSLWAYYSTYSQNLLGFVWRFLGIAWTKQCRA